MKIKYLLTSELLANTKEPVGIIYTRVPINSGWEVPPLLGGAIVFRLQLAVLSVETLYLTPVIISDATLETELSAKPSTLDLIKPTAKG